MLLNFAVTNYRSIKDRQVLSLMAVDGLPHEESLQESKGGIRALPLALLFGANASGKSNILRAFRAMRRMVLGSVRLNPEDTLDEYDPFLLSEETKEEETVFEIEFLYNQGSKERHYRYGFSFTSKAIEEEWLYRVGKKANICLFSREKDDISIGKSFSEGKDKGEALNKNRLFLSLVAQLKGELSISIISWFRLCNFASALRSERYMPKTFELLKSKTEYAEKAKAFLQNIDVSIQDLSIKEEIIEKENLPKELPKVLSDLLKETKGLRVQSTHNRYDSHGDLAGEEVFELRQQESEGTQKVAELLGLIFSTLEQGDLLVIDELDAKLHPLLTRAIIQLFTNPKMNKQGAQLIFTTHDTNQLNLDYVRRDEIWFTEKNQREETQLYAHIEFDDFEESDLIADEYVIGRYGAIPRIKIIRG
jgi:abortive infection protein, putative